MVGKEIEGVGCAAEIGLVSQSRGEGLLGPNHSRRKHDRKFEDFHALGPYFFKSSK